MGTHNFIQEHISVDISKVKGAKSAFDKNQKTLQEIVGILFEGTVDEHSKITINGLRNDFGDKPRFTVLNDIVVIRFADIFHAVSIPVNHESIKKAIGKFIEQLKDKYTIKVISRPSSKLISGIGTEPTLIISGFTEEELNILRGNSAKPNRLTNGKYNNHKFALIEKEAKPGSNYIIFDDIETLQLYKDNIKDQYGIESEVYHIDTNNFDLEKVNLYGKLYEGYYITSESLPMVNIEFTPFDGYATKSVFEDIIIVSGCYLSDDIDYYEDIDNFIKNHGGKDVNGFEPASIRIYHGDACDYILAYKKPLNNDVNIIPFVLFQEFINSSETIKRVINGDIIIYIDDLKHEFLEFIKTYDNPKNLYGLTERLSKVKQYIKDGIIGVGYLGYYIEKASAYAYGSKLDYCYSRINDKRIIYPKGVDDNGITSTTIRIIKDNQDLVYGDIIETSTDFDEDTTIGVFINSVIDNGVLIDKHASYLYASIACDEKVAKAIVDESDYSDFGIWKEKNISTYRGSVFGMCEFSQGKDAYFGHQVKFYTIKELLEMGCIVSRLDKTSYAVSGFTDLDDSLIKEYQITRL